MAIANIKMKFICSLDKVWNLVTSLDNYSWRSDLDRIKVLEEGKKFIEYTKDGYATTFTITVFKPMERYEFDMDNDNMHGNWIGIFLFHDGETFIDFTENVTAKKILLKPFVKLYLKKQQALYIKDLKNALDK